MIGEAHKTAINSMFDWYQRAAVCYVYLADVPPSKPGEDIEEAFSRARWLTRGWTLQEFLAASPIRLFDSAWQKIEPSNFPSLFHRKPPYKYTVYGIMSDRFVWKILHHFTGIDKDTWKTTDVPTRLSWAARRQTSRQEDMAYCLLGLLGINMPLLYGEGSSAFPRLLEELIKKSNSHGLLASWYGLTPLNCGLPLLPRSPFAYAGCTNGFQEIPLAGKSTSRHFSLTNAGLHIELPLVEIDHRSKVVLGLLNCQDVSKTNISQLALVLSQRGDDQHGQTYYRSSQPLLIPIDFDRHGSRKRIYIGNSPLPYPPNASTIPQLLYSALDELGYVLNSVYPPFAVKRFADHSAAHIHCRFGKDTFVVLFTAANPRSNIVLFSHPPSFVSSGKFLVSLTDSVSVIEFLLKEKAMHTAPSAGPTQRNLLPANMDWSTRIDLETLEDWSCWSHDVHIDVPGSHEQSRKSARISTVRIENHRGDSATVKIRITAVPSYAYDSALL
ncbi:hypothetical protein GGR55DRAFT_120257 [Xylaria sp. FL0064]|nr:hypothetical protein GGR55DRAFT_120257 [Xylaria sp. FL0064]